MLQPGTPLNRSVSRSKKRLLLFSCFLLLLLGAGAWVLANRSPASPPTILLKDDCPAGRDVRVVSECPGTLEPHRHAWSKAHVESEIRVRVAFTGGIGPCWVLDHVAVVETPQRVTLSLYEGYDPVYARYAGSHRDGSYNLPACVAIGISRETFVELATPLAGRPIVDGEGFPNFCAIKSVEGGREVWLSQGYSQPCTES